MSLHLLDTNICIYLLKGKYPSIEARLREFEPNDVGLPAIVVAELLTGSQKSRRREHTLEVVRRFVAPLRVLPFDAAAAEQYARLRSALEGNGTPIGPNDLIVASTALAANATLVTHNVREFARVPGLACVDWTAA